MILYTPPQGVLVIVSLMKNCSVAVTSCSKEAFEHVTQKTKIEAKWNASLTKAQFYAFGAADRNWFLDMIGSIRKPEMAKG